MNALLSLWLPILLSAVVVFVLSSLVHMVIKWHAPEYRGFSNEDTVRDAIRAGNPSPGQYVVPYCKEMKEMGGEAMQAKYKEGPVGYVVLAPNGAPNMGKSLGLWFLFSLLISVVAAYLTVRVIGLDPSRARGAAKLIAAVSFVAYGFGTITDSIWMARSWLSSFKYLVDAAIYAVGSGLIFYWLWPA